MICLLERASEHWSGTIGEPVLFEHLTRHLNRVEAKLSAQLAHVGGRARRQCQAVCLPRLVLLDGSVWWYSRRCLAVTRRGDTLCASHRRPGRVHARLEQAEVSAAMTEMVAS